jgi:hypothetical protein
VITATRPPCGFAGQRCALPTTPQGTTAVNSRAPYCGQNNALATASRP